MKANELVISAQKLLKDLKAEDMDLEREIFDKVNYKVTEMFSDLDSFDAIDDESVQLIAFYMAYIHIKDS